MNKVYKAAVIGAGPAGITAVANLLEFNLGPILWIDPEFKCGKLNSYYNVPGNTRTKYYYEYFNHLSIFKEAGINFLENFENFDKEETCPLLFIIDALKEVMKYFMLRDDVQKLKSTVKKIDYRDGTYTIDDQYQAEYVFFCTGSEPTGLTIHSPNQEVLDMITVVNDDYSELEKNDQVAVFGSSHSAMLAIMNLSRYTKKIVNFYRSEVLYAIPKDGWILYDDTGLKGKVADWTKANVDKLVRYHVDDPKHVEAFKSCNKIVYCTGLARVALPELVIDGKPVDTKKLEYDVQTGRIHDKLYGFGIAFPKQVTDRMGNQEFSVGIWKFMWHIKDVVSKFAVAEAKQGIIPVGKGEMKVVDEIQDKPIVVGKDEVKAV